jgi:hypothetical protein
VGVSPTIREIGIVIGNCRRTRFVLAGYSQGAMVIHQAESRLDARLGDQGSKSIIGTLLLGDGDRRAYSKAKRFGSAAGSGEGIRVYLTARDRRTRRPQPTLIAGPRLIGCPALVAGASASLRDIAGNAVQRRPG